jgi:hypothetical protein
VASPDEEPVELVFTDQAAVGFSQGEGAAEPFAAALVRIAKRPASAFGAALVFSTEIEDMTIFEAQLSALIETVGFFFFRENKGTSNSWGHFVAHHIDGNEQARGCAGGPIDRAHRPLVVILDAIRHQLRN